MKTKHGLYLLLLLFVNISFAQKFYGGEIIARQTATYGAEAVVEFFTAADDDDITTLELCWGDGICENITLLFTEAYPDANLRYYRFGASHVYGYEDTFTLSVSRCCWAEDIININTSSPIDFELTAHYFHSVEDILFGENQTPEFETGIVFGNALRPVRHDANMMDTENDEIHVSVCGIENTQSYSEITEIYPTASNFLLLDSLNGDFDWLIPQVLGQYVLALCITETRNEVIISERTRYLILAIDEPVSTQEVFESDQIKVFPNPASDQLSIAFATNPTDFELSAFDAQGREVLAQYQETSLDIQSWSPGLYTLLIHMDGQLYSKRFIVE